MPSLNLSSITLSHPPLLPIAFTYTNTSYHLPPQLLHFFSFQPSTLLYSTLPLHLFTSLPLSTSPHFYPPTFTYSQLLSPTHSLFLQMTCSLQQLTHFPTDMNASAWDAQVSSLPPFPTMAIASDNIIADLELCESYTSAIHTSITINDDAPSPVSDVSDTPFHTNTTTLVGHKRSASAITPQPFKKQHTLKHEQMFEPLTPPSRKSLTPRVLSTSPAVHVSLQQALTTNATLVPVSPLSAASLCTEASDERRCANSSDVNWNVVNLSKDATAKRRALRRAVMKRNRSRRDEGSHGVKNEPTTVKSDSEVSSDPVDKKAARAIRNREAAMKSRVEAKQKMQKLQDENESLNVKVSNLALENQALTEQLKSLLKHSYGLSINEGQDVKKVFNMLPTADCSN